MKKIQPSGIRKIFHLIEDLPDPVDFSIGQPDFDVPREIKQAAVQAMQDGFNRYTVTQGIPELREKLSESIRKRTGQKPEAVMITAGVSGGLLLAMLAILDPGDEVLVADPYFVMYQNLAAMVGATVRTINTYPDFRLRSEKIRAHVTERTKVLVFNNPVNPTGIVYTAEEVRSIGRVAQEQGLVILSDEIYDAFVYDGPFRSMFGLHPQTILLAGFSKTYGIPGWRIGYAAGPREVLDAMTTLQQFSYVCAHAPAQKAMLAAMDCDMSPFIEAHRRKRDRLYEGLREAYRFPKPEGAFYAFPEVPWGDDAAFVEAAIARGLLVVPGSACSRRNTHFRISFASPDGKLERGIEILRDLASGKAAPRGPSHRRNPAQRNA